MVLNASMEFTFEIDTSHLDRSLRAVRETIERPEAMLSVVGLSLHERNRVRHLAGQAPDGTAWKPLAASTVKRKGSGGY